MMLIPPPLKPGDKIGIVSTARKIMPEELGIALKTISEWGYEPVMGRTIGAAFHQFAGNDDERLADFQRMINDESIKAIMCARGGYGTVRIIDRLDFGLLQQNPKWIIGYSDVTVLHAHLHTNYNLCTMHAAMPINFGKNTVEALKSIKDILAGQYPSYTFDAHSLNRMGKALGRVVGGNLSILYNLAGTSSDIDTTGKILFLEDLDEYLYHIDRMMMNLKRNGKLQNLAGLIIGGMTDMNDNQIPYGKAAEEIIFEHTADYSYPVAFGFPAGHIDDNRALIMGAEAVLDVNDKSCKFYHP